MGFPSKEKLLEKYIELGGKREDFAADIDDVKAVDIHAAIERLEEAEKLKADLSGAGEAGNANAPAASAPDAPEVAPDAAAPAAKKTERAPNAKGEVRFVLERAHSFSTAKMPGKKYHAGVEFSTGDTAEIAIIRTSGLFKELAD